MLKTVTKYIENLDFQKEFVCDDINGTHYTYNEFFFYALQLATFIDGSVKDDSVIAVMNNSFELALLYFAMMFTDKRILVIDPQKGEEEIRNVLGQINDTGIFLSEDSILKDKINHKVLAFPEMIRDYEDNNIRETVINKLENRREQLPYLVTFTSGTSGNTKGVEHTLENLFLTALALDEKVGKRGGSFIHVMPMTYMAGILNSLIYPFIVGSRIIITKRFSISSARFFWKTVIKYDVDLFWLSPSMLMMIDQLDRKKDGEEYCHSKELTFLIGTAALSHENRSRFNSRYGVNVFASYGLSETLFVSVETKKSLLNSDKNCVGELLNGVEYRFSDTGEMLINVPWMFLGYTNENTASYFEGAYYKSGDLAEIRDGYLYITGRSKDLIVKGGMNISPILIENIIGKKEEILENVVIGVKDNRGEEKVCSVYKLRCEVENREVFEAELKKTVIEELGINYALDYLWQLNEIPRNINGKIDKKQLIKMWENKNE